MILDQYELVIFDADGTLRDCTVEGQLYPHSINGVCDCQKTAAGMLDKIIQHFGVAASETVFIGDSPRDKIAAENADCDFLWIYELTGPSVSKNEVMDSLHSY